jgi:hypothetical protein
MKFQKQVNWQIQTAGDGLWSNKEKLVRVSEVSLAYVNDECDFGELRARFDMHDWNVDKDGLIYTDSKWIEEFRALIKSLGFSPVAVEDISYSEQGMQGNNYVSMDVGAAFMREIEPMYRWLINKETVNAELA